MEWIEPGQMQAPQQLCKHQSLGVSSALAHKLFVFGGQIRPQYFSGDVDYFDTGVLDSRCVTM